MARSNRPRLLLIGLGAVLAGWVIWMLLAEIVWRNPEMTADQDAVVQPATVPPPGGVSPDSGPPAAGENAALRGQSAVRGDGTSINGSTQAPGAE